MEDGELIKKLGGGTQLSAELAGLTGEDIDREAIYKWSTQGIPWRWRSTVAAIAEKSHIELPKDFLTRRSV